LIANDSRGVPQRGLLTITADLDLWRAWKRRLIPPQARKSG